MQLKLSAFAWAGPQKTRVGPYKILYAHTNKDTVLQCYRFRVLFLFHLPGPFQSSSVLRCLVSLFPGSNLPGRNFEAILWKGILHKKLPCVFLCGSFCVYLFFSHRNTVKLPMICQGLWSTFLSSFLACFLCSLDHLGRCLCSFFIIILFSLLP